MRAGFRSLGSLIRPGSIGRLVLVSLLATIASFNFEASAPASAKLLEPTKPPLPADVGANFARAVDLNWARHGSDPVLPKGNLGDWDAGGVAAKSIVRSGETYYMYYQGDDGTGLIAIGLATSTDLFTWTKDPSNPILARGKGRRWDSFWVGMPSVVVEGSDWKMLYEGSDGAHSRLGLATSRDGVHWTKFDSNPVLGPGSRGAWDDTYLGTASIVPMGNGYNVFYVAATFPPHGEVGLATTPDLVHFEKEPARVITRGGSGDFDSYETSSSSIVETDSGYLMLMSGYDGSAWKIGYAYSIDGKTFQKSTGNPLFGPSTSGWDSLSVQLPIMVTKGNTSYLFYAGAGSGYQEGLAVSTTLVQAN